MKEIFLAILVFAVVGAGAVWGFQYHRRSLEATDTRPSIANFASVVPESLSNSQEASSVGDAADSDDVASPVGASEKVEEADSPADVAVKVFNAGSVGGSAGKMVNYLKTNGYIKAETGNAEKAEKGIVIYFSETLSDEANALQLTLLKSYKGVESKSAEEAKVPEAKSAPIVIMIGS